MDDKQIQFDAEVRSIKTMADGTVNVTLNLPEYCIEQAKRFIDWHGLMVKCAVLVSEKQEDYGL